MEDGHAKTSEEVLKYFGTNEEVGLTPDQVKSFQAKYGPNGEYQPRLICFRTARRLWELHCCIFYDYSRYLLLTPAPPERGENKLYFCCLIYDFASAECKQKK